MEELSNVSTQKFILFNKESGLYVKAIDYLFDYPCGYTDGISSSPRLFDEHYLAEAVIESLKKCKSEEKKSEARALEVIPVECTIKLERKQ